MGIQLAGVLSVAPMMLFGATTSIQSSICQPVATPTISTPASGSTLSPGNIYVAGTSSNGTNVTLYVDNISRSTVAATASGSYGVTVPITQKGTHTLRVTAASACTSASSATTSITIKSGNSPAPTPTPTETPSPRPTPRATTAAPRYLTATSSSQTTPAAPAIEPLTLSIDAALDGSTVSYATVYVSGKLSRDGTVKVARDGTVIAEMTAAASSFGFSIPLVEGKNALTITATASDGATVMRDITITRSADKTLDSDTQNYGSIDTPSESSSRPWYDGLLNSIWLYVAIGVVGLVIMASIGWAVFAAIRRRQGGGIV